MIAAVVTSKGESETICDLVSTLVCRYALVVVAVADDNPASRTETALLLRDRGAVVHEHGAGYGIGPCLMYGWRLALKAGAHAVIQLDAGGSHDPLEAGRLIDGLNRHDLVIGSRFMPGAQYVGNPRRRIMSRLAASACNLRSGAKLSDWTSGYRAFSRKALETLLWRDYTTTMHSWQIEVLRNAVGFGLRIGEVPITYRAGRSSFNRQIARDALRVWATL